jgi:hypothetical protein
MPTNFQTAGQARQLRQSNRATCHVWRLTTRLQIRKVSRRLKWRISLQGSSRHSSDVGKERRSLLGPEVLQVVAERSSEELRPVLDAA